MFHFQCVLRYIGLNGQDFGSRMRPVNRLLDMGILSYVTDFLKE